MGRISALKDYIINRLSAITDEERDLINGNSVLKKEIYSRSSNFRIEKGRISLDSYGTPTSPVLLRPNTRFASFPPHTHDYIELMYVCRGSITHVIGGEELCLGEGDIIILGKSTVHSIKKSGENDIGINMFISMDFFTSLCSRLQTNALLTDRIFDNLLQADGTQFYVFHTAGILPVENLIESMINSIITNDMADPLILQTEFELLTCYLAKLPESVTALYGMNADSEYSKRILINYIKTSYKSATLTEAAGLLGLTPAYLSRWTKSKLGMPFKQLLMEKRFSVAVGLITETSTPINVIISDVGYENSSYFHKQFLRRYGITPKTMREKAGFFN